MSHMASRIMRTLVVTACLTLGACLGAGQALAGQSGFYIGAKTGFAAMGSDDPEVTHNQTVTSAFHTSDSDYSGVFGMNLGYDFDASKTLPVRVEFEYMYHGAFDYNHNIQGLGNASIETTVHTFLVNGFLDWHNSSDFVPYLQGGLGVAYHDTDATADFYSPNSINDGSAGLAWNLGLGSGYKLSQSLTADLGYRYAGYGNVNAEDNMGDKFKYYLHGHEILFGLRYGF